MARQLTTIARDTDAAVRRHDTVALQLAKKMHTMLCVLLDEGRQWLADQGEKQ